MRSWLCKCSWFYIEKKLSTEFLSLNLVVLIVVLTEIHTLQKCITVVVFSTKCCTASARHSCLRNRCFNYWLVSLGNSSLLLEGKVLFVGWTD